MNTDVNDIINLQHEAILRWKKNGATDISACDFLALAEENHAFNYQLWHAEDRARRDDRGFEFVYQAKREIDACNQQRNNRMESMDEYLFVHLKPASHEACPVHSETPGMIIDRLSIMALKIYHMNVQAMREDADETHRQQCQRKLDVLKSQHLQLQNCLKELLQQIKDKTRTFRVYHQFKMYNDAALNPELYTREIPHPCENG